MGDLQSVLKPWFGGVSLLIRLVAVEFLEAGERRWVSGIFQPNKTISFSNTMPLLYKTVSPSLLRSVEAPLVKYSRVSAVL